MEDEAKACNEDDPRLALMKLRMGNSHDN
eukprot:SAG11_NODE_35867_length_264_cov_1.242424_2_plen_28_part_01